MDEELLITLKNLRTDVADGSYILTDCKNPNYVDALDKVILYVQKIICKGNMYDE